MPETDRGRNLPNAILRGIVAALGNQPSQFEIFKANDLQIDEFIKTVISVYETGEATEHSYRSALEALLRGLGDEIAAINEPKRVKCGAPDFIVQINDIAIGHVEAKDIGIDLRKMKGAECRSAKAVSRCLT